MAQSGPFYGAQVPESVKAQILADQLIQKSAAEALPFTSRGVGLAKIGTGLVGGLMEGIATRNEQQAQAAHRLALANALMQPQGGTPGMPAAPADAPAAPGSATPTSAPGGQAGIGSDRVASGSHTDFINSIMPQAQRVAAQTGLDPRLVAAQAALESNYGRSAPGGNLFGIKGPGTVQSTMESVNGQMVPTKASFASYDSPNASFDGYGKLMSGSRFAGVRNAQGLDAQIDALGKSGYATDPNYAAKIGAIARGIQVPNGQSTQADMPAPNATPTGSDTLPPGITPDMVSSAPPSPYGALRPMTPQGNLTAPATPTAPSPYGGPPQAMQAPTAAQTALANALAPQTASPVPTPAPTGSDTPPLAADPNAPPDDSAPALTTQLDQNVPDGNAPPVPDASMMSAAADPGVGNMLPATPPMPPPGAQSQPQGNPYGGPPQPMAPQVGPQVMADALAPASVAGSNLQGAAALSPTGGALSAMGPNGMDPRFVPPSIAAGAPSAGALPLSSDTTPGMDNFAANGGVRQSSLGNTGYTGGGDGLQAAINGNLRGPNVYVGGGTDPNTPSSPDLMAGVAPATAGPQPAPFTPDPATMAKFNAIQANGLPMGGGAAPAAPPQAPQPSPAALANALGPAPGTGAALPQTGPMPPPGAQTIANASVNPNAPAPGAIPAGPAPIPPQVMAQALAPSAPQPMGLRGNAPGADPMSAQSFNKQQAMANALAPSPGGVPPAAPPVQPPAPPMASSPMGGAGGPPTASASPPAGGGMFGGLGSLFGGQPQPAAQINANMTPQQQYAALLADPRTSPQEAEMIMQRLNPAPVKLSQGDVLTGRRADGTYGTLYAAPLKNKFTANENGDILNTATGDESANPNAYRVESIDAGNGVKVPMAVQRNADGTFRMTPLLPNGAPAGPTQPMPAPGGGQSAASPPAAGPITFGGQQNAPMPSAPGGPLTVPGSAPAAPAVTLPPSGLGPQVDAMRNANANAAAQEAGAKASAEANAKNDVEEVGKSRESSQSLKQSGEDLAQAQAALDAYKGKMPSGPFGKDALWARGVANTVGLGDPNQLSNMEIFSKNATKIATAQIKTFSSRGTNLDMETELKNNPGLDVSDQSNRILIDHLAKTNAVAQQYEAAKQAFYTNNGTLRGFQPQWENSISGAGAQPLSSYPIATKTIGGQTYQKVLSTDKSGYSWIAGGVQ